MVGMVFKFLCSALIVIILVEIATLIFVIVHEVFREKRKKLREYFRNKK